MTRLLRLWEGRDDHPQITQEDAVPPRIVTARSIGLAFRSNMSGMGPETSTVGHYSAGPRAATRDEGIQRAIAFHAQHQMAVSQGGLGAAGIGYHFLIPDDGSIICGRSTSFNGAHVLNNNSGRIGVNMPGTTGDKPTKRQARTFRWLLQNAHTDAMPKVHRTDNELFALEVLVHKDLMATSCPGLFTGMYHRKGRPWVEPSNNTGEQPDDGFEDLTPEDEEAPPVTDDAATVGPDDDERVDAPIPGETLELPEADDEFDEDLSDLLERLAEREAHPTA